jgi:hypothetical protein
MRVLLIGLGDLGYRIAAGLAAKLEIDEIVCAGGGRGEGAFLAGKLDSCYEACVSFTPLDATRQRDVETLITAEQPDLIVMCASLLNPWEVLAATTAQGRRIRQAGTAVKLCSALPILLSVMRAVRNVDYRGPVASLPWPDGTHPILAKLNLCPTIGLGNASMILMRVRAALRHRARREGQRNSELPLVRVLGDAGTLWPCLAATPPSDPNDGCRIYLGEDGTRADALAYEGHPWPAGFHLNELTAASALPVLKALLPGTERLRFTCPGIDGNPGGYPVRIEGTEVTYDFPPGVELADAVAINTRHVRAEGVERIEHDGTVIYTEAARAIMADIAPELTEPLAPDQAMARFPVLLKALGVTSHVET